MVQHAHRKSFLVAVVIAAVICVAVPFQAFADVGDLIPGTAVLLDSATGGGGNGGNTSSTSSSTNIFSPAAYVDYKRLGGEPSDIIDRYPFTSSFQCQAAVGVTTGQACQNEAACPAGTTSCYHDITYVSSPQGVAVPHYSMFWKSEDLGQTFRVPQHVPVLGENVANGGGGGDSYQVVGPISHRVFFVDLPLDCVTMNVSSDLGESFTPDQLGCGLGPGLDDRQWVDVDETAGANPYQNVYVTVNNDTNALGSAIQITRSQTDGSPGSFAAFSPCNLITDQLTGNVLDPDSPTANATPTPCPDPADQYLDVAGPVVVDKSASSPYQHSVYVPFARNVNGDFKLYIARSEATSATPSSLAGTQFKRYLVADLGPHDPANIFVQMTIDTAGNLYYTWSQNQTLDSSSSQGGEQDVYYAFSTNGGSTWSPPIDLTPEKNDSAIFPWLVAGSPGQVDLVYYEANTGLNSNVAEVDANGNPCTPPALGPDTCAGPNPSVWNVYFAQSQNALNTGSNFSSVQISDHPNHLGQICTGGVGCTTGGNRNLLDFFTVDVDHLGAANVVWADDNNQLHTARNKFSRQIAGNSVFRGQNISLQSSWPITNHAVSDRTGDVYDGAGIPKGSCSGMDLVGPSAVSEQQSNGNITISLTLNGPPTAANARACSTPDTPATGGIWGAEFWASSAQGPDNFYIAYRDNATKPDVEGGSFQAENATLTSLEFRPEVPGTLGGTCLPAGGTPATGTCTITMTLRACSLGIKPGAGLYSITGLSAYQFDTNGKPPLLTLEGGNSEQADSATAFDDNGTGTTSTSSAC